MSEKNREAMDVEAGIDVESIPARPSAQPALRGAAASLGPRLMLRKLQRRAARNADDNGVSAHAESAVENAASSSGSPLPADLQGRFESSLGTDLSSVRVHTGEASQAANRAVSARAYTTGKD